MKRILETDLFPSVKELLVNNGYKVCSEIAHCDIAAMKGEELIIVELKTSLTIDLLIQGVKRQRMTENVYIAIPENNKILKSKKFVDLSLLIKRLGLGLILVSKDMKKAHIMILPELFDMLKSMSYGKRKKAKLIEEFNGRSFDNNIGGSRGKKIMTSYKDKSLFIVCCIDLFGPLSPKDLKMHGSDAKKTDTILRKNFNNWFYRVKKGLYDLTDDGRKAIEQYKEVTAIHKDFLLKNNGKK